MNIMTVPLAIVLGATVIGALLAAFPRTTMVPAPYGYIERDRWTGWVMACSVAEPGAFLQRELTTAEGSKSLLPVAIGGAPGMYRYTGSDKRDPPRICLDLD